ncbi:MAG: sulfatase-like hydrolase/transferase [Succinivibrionaceae bacterium]|nr:sulfatase-like hydrolase/transferase [Succinivibrionaceae bacterium]MDY6374534.1 sulfatase-like hydrolase/transferase [Succinivibrionaceae bacterium]
MKLPSSGRPTGFYSRIIVAVFLLFTVAASCILYKTTRYNQPGSQLSSYSLKLEARGFDIHEYNFVYSCLFSDSGSPCREQNARQTIYYALFAIVNLSADVTAGNYRGMRVKINGSKGQSFELKSVTLQGEQVFDGQDYSVFKNVKGFKISQDRKSGLVVFKIESDSASFDLDCSFNAPGVSGTAIRYTSALLFTVLFISAIFLISLFGVSARIHSSGVRNREKGKNEQGGVLAAAVRISLVALVFDLLFLILFVCGQLFVFNEFSLSAEKSGSGRFMVEVSGTPYFGDSAGSTSFYSMKDTLIRVPSRFPGVRISMISESGGNSGFSASSPAGSCTVNDGLLEAHGSISCRTDGDGRLYLDFGGPGKSAGNVIFVLFAALAAAAAICAAFRFMRFSSALRLMLILIMISAYITGEICMNIEFGNILFYKDYLQLLPDVVLRNLCLIIFIFLLAELSYSRGFICSGTFLQVLLLVIAYVAVDWGVFQNFGVRPDVSTMLSHSGAGNSTFLVFLESFFRTSHASWMVLVMLADWMLMAFSFRQRENKSLKKYLLLVLLLNCIPFLKVYENLYTESSFMLRKDIFDIQGDSPTGERQHYTRDFPQYGWKPESQTIDGLGRRKNVVILLVESLASAYSHHFSGLKGYMPEIDRLAAENASFINYHSTGMETAPATYSIMTGKVFFSDLDRKSPDLSFEYGEALPKIMNQNTLIP